MAGGKKADTDPEAFSFGGTSADGFPWQRWTDGGIWLATEGEDFEMSPKSFSYHLKKHGRLEYKDVDVKIYGCDVFFRFREMPPLPPQFQELRRQLKAPIVAALGNGDSGNPEE